MEFPKYVYFSADTKDCILVQDEHELEAAVAKGAKETPAPEAWTVKIEEAPKAPVDPPKVEGKK